MNILDLCPYEPQLTAAWIDAVIGAVAAIGSFLFSNWQTNRANNKQKELQTYFMDKQNNFNKQMQDEQNAYNSYSNQKQLMEDAGLNPAFLFGSQAPDATQGSPLTSATPSPFDVKKPDADINSVARNLFDAKRLQNETMKNEIEIAKSAEETEGFKIANKQLEERLELERKEIESRYKNNDAERDLRIKQLATEEARQREIIKHVSEMDYNIQLLEQKAVTERWSRAKLRAEVDRIIQLTPIEASELISRANLNNQQAKVAAETINKVKNETVLLLKKGKQVDASTYSQLMDNALKEVTTENKISLEELKGEDDLMNLIYSECDGWTGSIAKGLAALSQSWSASGFDSNGNYRNQRHKRAQRRRNNATSWLFHE